MQLPQKLRWLTLVTGCAAWSLLLAQGSAQEIVDQWRYSLGKPADGWEQTNFDDASWQKGNGGFGEPSTPNSRVATLWTTSDI